ncbi:MAG TPA: hypothetical protein VGO47_01330 [Chlamydiales bacterium]|jgi:hypothetical protein|nr:hypothetical protein [Chlamydiales bacterium]
MTSIATPFGDLPGYVGMTMEVGPVIGVVAVANSKFEGGLIDVEGVCCDAVWE